MKISKLFHWLYAILMLLPFAFFVPSVLYYAFNDNATMQSVEVPKTESIAVNFNQKLDLTSYEPMPDSGTYHYFFNVEYRSVVDHIYVFRCSAYGEYTSLHINVVNLQYVNSPQFTLTYTDGDFENRFASTNGIVQLQFFAFGYIGSDPISVSRIQLFDLTQMFGSGNEPTIEQFNTYFPNSYYQYNEGELMQITYETGTTEQLIENTSIINYAWESIWDLPLFSWTKVTFVSVPFSYLTGIFGIGASNSLNYVFGYFVTISIVWLVFDLLLYVPMLAHNWIDKARIE